MLVTCAAAPRVGFLSFLPDVEDGLIAKELHGLPGGIFQVLGNGKGVLVRALIQSIQKANPVFRADAFPMEKGCYGPEGGG